MWEEIIYKVNKESDTCFD